MKSYVLFIFLLSGISSFAQFGSESYIDTNQYGIYIKGLELADMNNDGYIDVVVAQGLIPGHVSIYYNDTMGSFGTETVVSSNSYQNVAMDTGDFNKDGWLDLIVVSKVSNLTLYENNQNGSFTATDLYPGIYSAKDIISLDIDQDGYMDFVSLHNLAIHAFTNDKTAHFDTSTVADVTEYYSLCAGHNHCFDLL